MLTLQEIKDKYGHLCSFALWQQIDISQKAKFGIGDISHFDDLENLNIKRNIILVGLNLSGKGSIDNPFQNFHSAYCYGNDYKIRYAIQDTMFSGAYMTDIIKDYEEVMSGKVITYLKSNPDVEKENIKSFEIELKDIGATNPIIIAFGSDCFKILSKLKYKYNIHKVPHFAYQGTTKEKLREAFNEISKFI